MVCSPDSTSQMPPISGSSARLRGAPAIDRAQVSTVPTAKPSSESTSGTSSATSICCCHDDRLFHGRCRNVRHLLAERRGQIDLVFLFLSKNLADVLGDAVLLQRLTI